MADHTTKILEVIVDNNRAVTAISEYNRLIDEQRDKQKNLAEQYKKGEMSQADYYQAVTKSKEEIKAYSRSVQELSKEIQNNIKDSEEQEGSLRGLRAQLSNLTKEYDALSRAERSGGVGEALVAQINSITNELKAAEEETQRFYRNVGNYPDVKPLEAQLSEIKQRLTELKYAGEDTSEEFKELSDQASRMKDAIADVEAEITNAASDTKGFDTALQGLSMATGGLTLISTMFADGSEEGEKLQKVLQKVQLVMMALTTLQTIQKNTQKQSLVYLAAEKVQLKAVNALKSLQTTLTAKQTAATGAQTVAQKILNAVMKANPVGLLVAGIAALTAGAVALTKALSGGNDELERQKKALEDAERALEDHAKTFEESIALMERTGASSEAVLLAKIKGRNQLLLEANAITKQVMKEESDAWFYDDARVNEYLDRSREKADALNESLTDAALTVRGWASENAKYYEQLGMSDLEKEIDNLDRKYNDQIALITYLREQQIITAAEAGEATRNLDRQLKQAKDAVYKADTEAFEKKLEEGIKKQKEESEKRQKAMRDAAKREMDTMNELTDAKIALIKDETERETAEENARHERALQKLKDRLETEKNLTQKEKDAINKLIEIEEQRHQQNLTNIDWEAKEQRLKNESEMLKLRLEAVEEGGEAELDLKLKQLETLRDLELANTELTEEQKQLIRESYAKQEQELREQTAKTMHEKELEELRLFWQNQIDEAAVNNQNTLELEIQARKAQLDALHQFEGESDAEFQARQLEAKKAYIDAQKALDEYEVEIAQTKWSAIEGLMGGITQVMEAFGEENKELAKASKVLALAEIAINTGKAIAAGVAQAQSVPFPANLAAIGTTVTTVLANIASAISTVKSAKFATGGFVSGPGTGTSDSIPARLSNGESVINARSTAMFGPLLSSLNQAGGGVAFNPAAGGQREGYEFLAAAVAAGMKNVNLHVAVDEITQVQDRVARINEISTIG